VITALMTRAAMLAVLIFIVIRFSEGSRWISAAFAEERINPGAASDLCNIWLALRMTRFRQLAIKLLNRYGLSF
jgi:hypothetical protein